MFKDSSAKKRHGWRRDDKDCTELPTHLIVKKTQNTYTCHPASFSHLCMCTNVSPFYESVTEAMLTHAFASAEIRCDSTISRVRRALLFLIMNVLSKSGEQCLQFKQWLAKKPSPAFFPVFFSHVACTFPQPIVNASPSLTNKHF